MAWTQTDLDTLSTAIANNVRRVTFADGRSVEYHSADEMLRVRATMKSELLASASRISPQRRFTIGQVKRG